MYVRTSLYCLLQWGDFPLFWATKMGHLETVKLLLDHGADPNIPDEVSVAEHYSLYAAKMLWRQGPLILC